MKPVPRIGSVVFDCSDARTLADFWRQLLGTEVVSEGHGFIWLKPTHDGGPAIAFQEVADPTPGKNRLHIDTYHHDLEAVAQVIDELGGSMVQEHHLPGFRWTVFADPEGNQFCVGHEVDAG